ncbi:SH3-like domain-containing protein [Oceanicella sp. SM1341]|uniref:SH3-like domain-containing protein n=1 Tax=Oceanicella sp. SM1341 TaxID=1548889 RepID=UPI0018E53432|nr:SH3-like domain-containing protein [Oceanicella sp. SM1341]
MTLGRNIAMSPRSLPARHATPAFAVGDRVRIDTRAPVGDYRVPICLRGQEGEVIRVIRPATIGGEEEGPGRDADGSLEHSYRLSVPMHALWPGYAGSAADGLRVEISETWLEKI